MKYRNTVTGTVIETSSVISGGNWERVTDSPVIAPEPVQEKKKSASRKTTKPKA